MSWTGHPSRTDDHNRFEMAQAVADAVYVEQNRRAARVVAGRAVDVADCAEMLAMLGLDGRAERARR
jgi:uncharacterized NAD(P)/FAD-binding protein YdhS